MNGTGTMRLPDGYFFAVLDRVQPPRPGTVSGNRGKIVPENFAFQVATTNERERERDEA